VSSPVRPTVGEMVHYVSYGTPPRADGSQTYSAACRAAVVTEVGQWVAVETSVPDSFDRSEGRPIQVVERWWYDDAAALAVLNPTGVFFNGAAGVSCRYDEDGRDGGTWHYVTAHQ
jgi:hypothetical protein